MAKKGKSGAALSQIGSESVLYLKMRNFCAYFLMLQHMQILCMVSLHDKSILIYMLSVKEKKISYLSKASKTLTLFNIFHMIKNNTAFIYTFIFLCRYIEFLKLQQFCWSKNIIFVRLFYHILCQYFTGSFIICNDKISQ